MTIGMADVETAGLLRIPLNSPVAFVSRIALDRMISNGYESWVWDGRQAHGGWAKEDRVYQVRPGYADAALGLLERAWLRESGASGWTALGPWLRGAPLPSPPVSTSGSATPGPAAESADPPGWLVAGLPQGVSALVGGGGRRWMRWVGPPEAP